MVSTKNPYGKCDKSFTKRFVQAFNRFKKKNRRCTSLAKSKKWTVYESSSEG